MTVEEIIKRSTGLMLEFMDARDERSEAAVNVLRSMVLTLLESSIREAYQLGLDNAPKN